MKEWRTIEMACMLFIFGMVYNSQAQSLFDELDVLTEDTTEINYATATFKSTRIINTQSIEMPAKNEMLFIISHRFGSFENGIYDMFGLDQASVRLGFEYTLPFDNVCLSVGRSTYGKTFDGGIKVKILKQKTGYKTFPLTINWYSNMAVSSLRWVNPDRKNYFSSRISYAHQILIARKFNDKFSAQLSPTILHKNLVSNSEHENTFYALGIGVRYRFIKRVALTAEYSQFVTPTNALPTVNGLSPIGAFSIGFDIETGGHVFSLAFTNSRAMFDPGVLSETTQSWREKGMHFGFNVNRTFSLGN